MLARSLAPLLIPVLFKVLKEEERVSLSVEGVICRRRCGGFRHIYWK